MLTSGPCRQVYMCMYLDTCVHMNTHAHTYTSWQNDPSCLAIDLSQLVRLASASWLPVTLLQIFPLAERLLI